MKKIFPQIPAAILIVLLIIGCFGSDPGENRLIGTWKYSNYYTGSWEEILFREDLSYRLENYDGEKYQSTILNGTYRYDQEKFVFENPHGIDVAFEYYISGDSLITMNKLYLRQ